LVELLERGHAHLAQQLHDFAGLVAYAPPELALKLGRPLPNLARDLSAALKAATGSVWRVRIAGKGRRPRPPCWSRSRRRGRASSRRCWPRQW
jgi:DNA polymerase-3 subunit gamma/tau